jgi:hypothetical protein
LPWEKPGVEVKYGVNSLTSHILCDRHNSALSPLDQLAANAFRALRASADELNTISISRRKKWLLVSGEAVELWGYKALCGLYHSSVAAQSKKSLINTYSLDVSRFEKAVRLRQVDSGCGLYVTPNTGERKPCSFAPLSVIESRRVIGIRMGFAALEFDIILDPNGVNFDYLNRNLYFRPRFINLFSQHRRHTIVMSWPNNPVGSRDVDIRLRPTRRK